MSSFIQFLKQCKRPLASFPGAYEAICAIAQNGAGDQVARECVDGCDSRKRASSRPHRPSTQSAVQSSVCLISTTAGTHNGSGPIVDPLDHCRRRKWPWISRYECRMGPAPYGMRVSTKAPHSFSSNGVGQFESETDGSWMVCLGIRCQMKMIGVQIDNTLPKNLSH